MTPAGARAAARRRVATSGVATLLAVAAPAAAQLPGISMRPDTTGQGIVSRAAAQPRTWSVRSQATGPGAAILRAAVAAPHVLIVAPDTGLTLGRGVTVPRALVVIGGPLRLAATVRGDVIATGDFYLRPGADVQGRAVALGGGVYTSTLARVGNRLSYRDLAVTSTGDATGALALDVRGAAGPPPSRFSIPGLYGLQLPTYDRVNGLTVAVGAELALDTGRVRVEPSVAYRSQLGLIDPGVRATGGLGRGLVAELDARRGTFSNDAWSRPDLLNSIVFGISGRDARNYFRADRADLTLSRPAATARGVLEPLVGVRYERAWSADRDSAASRSFTAFGRNDAREGARRPNPAVTGGAITSALVGLRVRRDTDAGTRGRAEARVEQALDVERGGRFTRGVIDLALERPLAGDRRLLLLGHAALVAGRNVPTQRYAYLGGGPTLPTLFLLEQGGTQLVWAEGRYAVPLRFVRVPVVGTAPVFTVRGMAGAAGVGTLPALTPNIGLRLNVGPLRVDYVFDPTGAGRRQFNAGVGLR